MSALPIVERLREQVHTGSYYSDGCAMVGGDGSFAMKPATPMMRAANRDGSEAASIIEELYEAVRLFVEYDAGDEADGVALMLAYNNAIEAAKAALAKATQATGAEA